MRKSNGIKRTFVALVVTMFMAGGAMLPAHAATSRPRCETFPVVTRAQHRPLPGPPPTFYEVRIVTVTVRKCPGHAFKLHIARSPWHLPNR